MRSGRRHRRSGFPGPKLPPGNRDCPPVAVNLVCVFARPGSLAVDPGVGVERRPVEPEAFGRDHPVQGLSLQRTREGAAEDVPAAPGLVIHDVRGGGVEGEDPPVELAIEHACRPDVARVGDDGAVQMRQGARFPEHGELAAADNVLDDRPPAPRLVCMSCISNRVGGSLVSDSTWTGVPVGELLGEAGVSGGASRLLVRGADGYFETIPLAAAMMPTVLVAL